MDGPNHKISVTAHTRPPAALRLVTAKRHEALPLLQNPLPPPQCNYAAPRRTEHSDLGGRPDRSPPTARHDEWWRRLLSPGLRRHLTDCGQDELTALSSNHLHVVAPRSDHFVQRFDGQPDVVIRAVQAVVRAARDHTRRPPRRLLFAGAPFSCRSWLGRAHRPGRGGPLANGGWAWLQAALDRHPPGRHGQHQVVEPRRERVTHATRGLEASGSGIIKEDSI